jgi:hyaluronoglucosaminidase
LRSFTHRPASLRDLLAGHAANPMKQPALSEIPLATLPMSYAHGEDYEPTAAWRSVALRVCGAELAALIEADLPLFQDVGLERLTAQQRAHIEVRYLPHVSHAPAKEILGWMSGAYAFDPACLTD